MFFLTTFIISDDVWGTNKLDKCPRMSNIIPNRKNKFEYETTTVNP